MSSWSTTHLTMRDRLRMPRLPTARATRIPGFTWLRISALANSRATVPSMSSRCSLLKDWRTRYIFGSGRFRSSSSSRGISLPPYYASKFTLLIYLPIRCSTPMVTGSTKVTSISTTNRERIKRRVGLIMRLMGSLEIAEATNRSMP